MARSAERAAPGARRWKGSAEVDPEGHRTRRPAARHVLELPENVRRYHLLQPGHTDDKEPLLLSDDVTPAQRRLLQLRGVHPDSYGQ